jgi:Mce-associated membrane protein
MSLQSSPTLYDILGVPADASSDEIKTAWRDAADRFAPGEGAATRQFRLFNEAAEVLLDPQRRKEYDASLTSSTPPSSAEQAEPADGGSTRQGPAAIADTVERPATRRTNPVSAVLSVLGVTVTSVLALVIACAVGLAAYFVVEAEQAEAYQQAVDRAPAAAENAALAVLSYDHESLEADRDAAAKFLTDDYRADYVETFDKLVSDTASQTKATVEAQVLASSAMSGSRQDPDSVPVLLFVNQTTTSATSERPSVALNRVRFDMVEVDGTWLVDGITSY